MTHPCMYAIDSIVCHGHHQQKTQLFVSINLSIIHTDPSYGYIIYVIFVIVSILIIPIGLLTIYFKGYYMYRDDHHPYILYPKAYFLYIYIILCLSLWMRDIIPRVFYRDIKRRGTTALRLKMAKCVKLSSAVSSVK